MLLSIILDMVTTMVNGLLKITIFVVDVLVKWLTIGHMETSVLKVMISVVVPLSLMPAIQVIG